MIRESFCSSCRPVFDRWIFTKALQEYGITVSGICYNFKDRDFGGSANGQPDCNTIQTAHGNCCGGSSKAIRGFKLWSVIKSIEKKLNTFNSVQSCHNIDEDNLVDGLRLCQSLASDLNLLLEEIVEAASKSVDLTESAISSTSHQYLNEFSSIAQLEPEFYVEYEQDDELYEPRNLDTKDSEDDDQSIPNESELDETFMTTATVDTSSPECDKTLFDIEMEYECENFNSDQVEDENGSDYVNNDEPIDQTTNFMNEQEKTLDEDEYVDCEQSLTDYRLNSQKDTRSMDDVQSTIDDVSSQYIQGNDSIKKISKFDNWTQPIYSSETQERVGLGEVVAKLKGNYIIDKSKKLPYICLIEHSCLRSFVNSSHVENHLFSSFYFTRCPTCLKEFKNYDNMNRHHKKCRKKSSEPVRSNKRSVSVVVDFHPGEVQTDNQKSSSSDPSTFVGGPSEQIQEHEGTSKPEEDHNVTQEQVQVQCELEQDEEEENEEDEESKLVPRITVVRLPNFMKGSDQPASELDQIYSSFIEWYFRANRDYVLRYAPEKELESKSPIPASQVDCIPQSEEIIATEGNSGFQFEDLETNEMEDLESTSNQIDSVNINGKLALMEPLDPDVTQYLNLLQMPSDDECDENPCAVEDQLIEPIVLSKKQHGYTLKAKTKRMQNSPRSQRGSLVYQCPFCKFKCNPGHRYATLRHVNGYKSNGKFIKPKCRKRRKLKPADPETGVYEQIEPILMKSKKLKLKLCGT